MIHSFRARGFVMSVPLCFEKETFVATLCLSTPCSALRSHRVKLVCLRIGVTAMSVLWCFIARESTNMRTTTFIFVSIVCSQFITIFQMIIVMNTL